MEKDTIVSDENENKKDVVKNDKKKKATSSKSASKKEAETSKSKVSSAKKASTKKKNEAPKLENQDISNESKQSVDKENKDVKNKTVKKEQTTSKKTQPKKSSSKTKKTPVEDVEKVVLHCENLVKDFLVGENDQRVINGITHSFVEGEYVSIMGPSGSGKSTFLYLLSGIEKPTSGEVFMLDKDITKYSEKEMALLRSSKISFVFQNYNLIPTFTVYENVITPLLLGKNKVEESRVDMMLSNMNLLKLKNSLVTNLSGGEQQRVAIARALITDPIILFADEPTGNLDSKNSREVMELFSKINKMTKTTIIQVTHSEEIAKFGDRILRMLDGRIISNEKVHHEKDEYNY